MSEEWVVLLERVNAFRSLMAMLLPVLRKPEAKSQAFRTHALPLIKASQAFGLDQQECIAEMLDEVRISYGLPAEPSSPTPQ